MQKAFITPDKCLRCSKCHAAIVCPYNAIFRIDCEDPNIVESNLCRGCGVCVARCPSKAIKLKNG
jgi:heterodisulfide reductase subunit A